MLKTLTAVALVSLAMAGAASAATVSYTSVTPTGALNPTTATVTGTVQQNTTGSISGEKRSPFEGGAAFDDDFVYTSVSGGATATFDFGQDLNELSFIWGSPDSYNLLTFYEGGKATGETLVYSNNGANLADPFATIRTAFAFDTVQFSSSSNAFEFAQMSVANVPVPAAGLLLLSALGGIGFARRRKAA